MKEIIINACNGASRTFAAEDDATLREILAHDDVLAFFEADYDDIAANLEAFNGVGIQDGIRDMILNSQPETDTEVDIDLEGTDDEEAENSAEEGTPGRVTVNTSGGLQSTVIDIVNGVTTVREAVYNDAVRARSGMNDTQLSSCVIVLNGDTVNNPESVRLHDNDTIVLNPRAASTKGL